MGSEPRPGSLIFSLPRRSHLYSHTLVTNALRLLWVVLVIWGDLGAFFWSLSDCSWPEVKTGNVRQSPQTTHVLLVADPQVQHTLLLSPGSWWANPLRRAMFELNMQKSWHVTMRLRPHVVIFLGDMLANGKAARSLEEYREAANYFKSVFATDPRTKVYYVPGNNDVGLGSVSAVASNLRSYYTDSFGPLNQNIVISNHTFIALDAPALVDEDYHRHGQGTSFDKWKPIEGGAVEFVKEMAVYDPGNVILLSHIPLARPETADCGPFREKGGIRRSAGPGYQSALGRQTTRFLLKNLEPLVVFSADNRDYCEYTHVLPGTRVDGHNHINAIREVTVKSFSMSVHIRRPGFQLLSLVDPATLANPDFHSFADTPCLLPDQNRLYTGFYLPCLIITLLVLIVLNFSRHRSRGKPHALSVTPSPRSSGRNSPNPGFGPASPSWNGPWSPFSPAMPVSPRTTLPSYLRTPHAQSGSATRLVASLPGTPAPSSPSFLTVPMPFSDKADDDFDDDTMYPAQYAIRREGTGLLFRHREDDDEWSHVGQGSERDDHELLFHGDQEAGAGTTPQLQSKFISAPDNNSRLLATKKRKYHWSYTFVFKGRRRRISIGLPSWNSLHNFLDFFGFENLSNFGTGTHRGSGVAAVLVDILSVFWPAVVTWLIINWTIL
ncbi:hypothetical protein JR316_0001914 [Psilocybe cubensis]|uniref:Uncharacterized protein n=2 Tax=Psilocybe cubensis TaxID=181762 RepID=A0ACB8HB98_PSICU|nr:hypothetical protein JR316_0001914 [Psilocybe cubensis]KAH9485010.1 hypothetical protein JR316_0001914 [Psilocybe cubensis]